MLLLLGAVTTAAWVVPRSGRSALRVYCAHDAVHAEKILRQFEAESGIPVHVQFDTEATKSLGLMQRIIRERASPRCDVFWNNEVLGTMQLAELGLLEPYRGAGHERIPAAHKDPEGRWTGFAARMRVWIVNTNRLQPNEQVIAEALDDDLSRVAVAKPLYGTTRTHYTVLWDLWGSQRLERWHRSWRTGRVREVSGNAAVKNLVAAGTCDLGLTDTDDFFAAADRGAPVAMLPVRLETGQVICIPNTVAIIKGTGQRLAARALVEFLLSRRTELALARSASRQIPLGPVDGQPLPDQVRRLMSDARDAYPLAGLAPASDACLAWLGAQYLR
jgi:iron(III) transport system substrate-binding protein